MKAITVVLAIAALVTAQQESNETFDEMHAWVMLKQNVYGTFNHAGTLILSQASTAENITVSGILEGLEPAQYVVVMHEGWQHPGDCNSLGPVLEVDGRFFRLFYVTVGTSRSTEVSKSFRATLIPNKPRTIVNHTIGMYDVRRFNIDDRIPTISNIACGYIHRL